MPVDDVYDPSAVEPDTSNPPWADDLETVFTDPAQREQVDGFLREKIQPYVTQLEQSTVTNRDAEKLWNDFSENPVETYLAVAQELFGEEKARAIAADLNDQAAADPTGDYNGDPGIPDPPPQAQVNPEDAAVLEWAKEQQREQAYKAELDRVKSVNDDIEINENLFHPFVAAADGDFDLAVVGYREWAGQAKQEFGVPDVPDPNSIEPPPTLGGDASAPPVPPTTEKYETIDDALDAFFDEQKKAPPTV